MTSVEVLPYAGPPVVDTIDLAPKAFELAQRIARTDFVPTALRGKPEAVLAAILTGHEVGIGAMQALSKIHVIEGRPAMASELMRALVLRAGHELVIEESNTTRCTVIGVRAGSSRETRMSFSMDDAKRAGLDGRQNWRKYPAAMLLARATAALCRAIFPDVLAGISYTVEELQDGDVIDAEALDGDADAAPAPKKATKTRKATKSITASAQPAEPAPEPKAAQEAPPLPGEGGYEGPDQDIEGPKLDFPQYAAMRARSMGIEDDEVRHGLWLAVTAGRVSSAKDLDDEERKTARSVLESMARGELLLGVVDRDGPDEGWAVLDADGTARHFSRDLIEVADLDIVAGGSEAKAASSAAAAPASPDGADSSGTPEPDASPRPSTPSEGSETGPPGTEAEWRAFMRERQIRMSDLARVVGDLRPQDPGVSVGKLVEDPALGAEVFARVVDSL